MNFPTGNLKTHEERFIRDKGICGGEPVSKGTRVTLRTVLASLADGDSVEEMLAGFPSLKAEYVQAAIAFAAMPVPLRDRKEAPNRPGWPNQRKGMLGFL